MAASFDGGLSFTTNVHPTASMNISAGGGYVHAGIPEGHVSVSAGLPTASLSVNSGHVSVDPTVNFSMPSASYSIGFGESKMGVSVSADMGKVEKKKKDKEKKGDESLSSSSEDEGGEKKAHKSPKAHASAKATVAVPAVNLSGGGAAVTLATPTVVASPTGVGVSFNAGYTGPSVGVAVASPHGGAVSLGGLGGVAVGVGAPQVGVSVSADATKVEKKKKEKGKHGHESSASSSEDEGDGKKSHKSSKGHASVKATVAVPAVHLGGGAAAVTLATPTIVASPIGGGVSFNAGYAGPSIGMTMASPHGGHVSLGGVGNVSVGGGGIAVTTAYPAQRTVVTSSGSCTLL